MYDEPITINPPLYLASAIIGCWRCGAEMPAVTLVAPNVPDTEGTVCILSDIRELPPVVRHFIEAKFPTFQLRYSTTTRFKYYASTCPQCRVLSGQFYLHSEPGAPFFPTDEQEAGCLTLEEVPLDGPIQVRAGLGMGPGELILEHARRAGAQQGRCT